MLENKILSAVIQDRSAYDIVRRFYESDDFTDLGELVYREIVKYYRRDPDARQIDRDTLLSRLQTKKYRKHADKFERFIQSLRPVSIDNILDDYRDMKRTAAAESAGSYLIEGNYAKAQPYLDKYQALTNATLDDPDNAPKVYQDAEADDFTESLKVENRIPIAPRILNENLGGGLIRGGHLIIYATPEVGKTAAAINVAYGIAASGRLILYFGNEETPDMYLNRMLCRFTRWTFKEVLRNKPAAMKLARKRGWSNLIFIHLSPGTLTEVQALILEHHPEVVIIDQLPNLIVGKGKEPEKTQKLEVLAYHMRMFYARHGIAGISISQADEKAIGRLYLTIKNIYYSNIAVQGQCDAMVGIGMDYNYEAMGRRMLCITKNKLGGPHVNLPVILYNEISMLKGL